MEWASQGYKIYLHMYKLEERRDGKTPFSKTRPVVENDDNVSIATLRICRFEVFVNCHRVLGNV